MRPVFTIGVTLVCAVSYLALTALDQPTPQAPTTAQEASQAAVAYDLSNDRERWAYDLLTRLGNPQPSPQIIAFVVSWTLAEDTSNGAFARNNPLNTTMCGYNMIGSINADGACGVGHYATYEDGMGATIATLQQSNFATITAALLANDSDTAREALWASPWAASHYNYGVGWPRYEMAAPQPARQATDGVRRALVEYALSLQGVGYSRVYDPALGFRPDCSGTMNHVFRAVAGINIGSTTFDQYPRLQPIEPSEVLPGDLWYGVFPADEHTGMVADVDGDGRLDLIHNGADQGQMHVTPDFMSTYLGQYTKGFRRAL